ncbi:MAG: hypothetical protein BroJett025_02630 [Patescibacteria group bacterium]|nr:MAG: hypothetical protein BroJett025_02630 [Patescibacteria group bacterium]
MNNDTKPKTKRKGFIQPQKYVLVNSPLTNNEKAVYLTLLSHRNSKKKNSIYPGLTTIALESNCSKSTVIRALKRLEGLGLVKWKVRGQGKTNLYSIKLESKTLEAESKRIERENKKQILQASQIRSVTMKLLEVSPRNTNNKKNINKKLNNIVTYSASTESVSASNVVTNTSLPSVNQEEAKPAETFIPVGELSGGDSRNASVEEGPRVSDYSKYAECAEQGWQLVDQVKNPQPRPLTDKDPYFFHAWVANKEQEYPWPQDMQNQWVLDQLKMVEDEWVDAYFEQKFKKKTNHRVHHFLSDGVVDKLQLKCL